MNTDPAPQADPPQFQDLSPEMKEIVPFLLSIALSIKHGNYLKAQELVNAALDKYNEG